MDERVAVEIERAIAAGERSPYRADDFSLHYRDGSAGDFSSQPVFRGSRGDIHGIVSIPYFNRYADKTQVYSLIANDDITRRSLHVQLVSHVARTIGRALLLNTDLIEAIALLHDLGHAPFGHLGERYLDKILFDRFGLHFYHSVQSVRIVTEIFGLNLAMETLDGALCHSGALFDSDGRLAPRGGRESLPAFLDTVLRAFRTGGREELDSLPASTMEGVVVRLSDIISYVGKDREDAVRLGYDLNLESASDNSGFMEKFIEDAVENSFGKPYVSLSRKSVDALMRYRDENFRTIYSSSDFLGVFVTVLRPLFENMFDRIFSDLKSGDESAPVYRHHIKYLEGFAGNSRFRVDVRKYLGDRSDLRLALVAADYMSSMSDDYFVSLSRLLFPNAARRLRLIDYFEGFDPNVARREKHGRTVSLFDA